MTTVIVNQFDGGQAEDIRTFNTNQQETSFNFNIYSNPHMLTPYIDMVAETMTSGTTTDFALTDVNSIIISGTTSLVALGRASSGSNAPTFFRKNSSSDITSGWQLYASGVNNKVAGSLVIYKSFAYCLGDTATAHNLQKFDGVSTVSTIDTLTNTNYSSVVPRPFVHPEDNVMYFADGNIIGKYDGSTFTATAFTLPDDKVVVSLTNYGAYLAIACRPKNGSGNSVCYLWGRDTSSTLLQGVLDLGDSQVNIIENLNNKLFFVLTKNSVGSYSNILQNILSVRGYSGGEVETITEVNIASTLTVSTVKQKVNEHLYFFFSGDTALYRFGKGKNGKYFLSHDRAYPSGATTIQGFSILGDFMWISYGTASTSFRFDRTISLSESQLYATTSTYVTTVNPSMVAGDRYKLKELIAVSIAFTGGTACNLKVSYDGGDYTTLISSSATGEKVIEATASNSDGSPLGEGREIQFKAESTGNAKIKEIKYIYREVITQMSR